MTDVSGCDTYSDYLVLFEHAGYLGIQRALATTSKNAVKQAIAEHQHCNPTVLGVTKEKGLRYWSNFTRVRVPAEMSISGTLSVTVNEDC